MDRIDGILNDYVCGARPNNSNTEIANFMLAHLNDLADMRLVDVANACFVSTTTVIRFVRDLGFSGYSSFKRHLAQELARLQSAPLGTDDLTLAIEGEGFPRAAELWSVQVAQAVYSSLESLDVNVVKELARDIVGYRHVRCIGAGLARSFGNCLASRLTYYGKAIVSMGIPDLRSSLTSEADQTLIIVVSQHGNILREAQDLLDYLHGCSDKVWLVTQVPETTFNQDVVDAVLRFGDYAKMPDAFSLLAVAELVDQWCGRLILESAR